MIDIKTIDEINEITDPSILSDLLDIVEIEIDEIKNNPQYLNKLKDYHIEIEDLIMSLEKDLEDQNAEINSHRF